VLREAASGQYEVRSNALDGLAIGAENGMSWASFTGKATYLQPGWADRVGNHAFTAHFEDWEASTDRAWLQVFDKDRALLPEMSLMGSATSDAIALDEGDVVVPAPSQGRRKN
jgi:hypothetical protein